MNPPDFEDSLNPILADDWLTGLERVYQEIQCTK